jgi:putative membrane protein
MMNRRLAGIVLAAGLAGFAGPALAQTPPVAQATPALGAAPRTSVSTADFRRLALMAETFEYESSRLALQRAQRRGVKDYASRLMAEYRPTFARLTAGAGAFSGLPSQPSDANASTRPFVDDRRAQMLNQLASAEGRAFDRLYIDMQAGMQQETLALYATYIQSGDDPALLAFARESLPMLQEHHRTALRLAR